MKENTKEMVGGCCVCSDERGWPDNPLVYCDGNGCTVAVHQACYGIIAVPTGPWYCRKCESPETKGKVRCDLCPSKSGALKRADTGGWAHVVCALYIPEVRFGNVTSMEPIVLRLMPAERYNKTCYICQDLGKTNRATAGACMQCNKSGCKQQFHVTCAQSLGLLCEEAGNYLDNVKYCGYCQHHYSKLKKGGNVKTIPPYKPITGQDSQSSDSSEKESDSPVATGSATPTHSKPKGPGRKSSHSSGGASGKNTPSTSKASTSTSQQSDKKKPSPSRRGSSADTAGSSKASTPAPSPQHSSDAQPQSKGSGRCTPNNNNPAKIPLPASSPKQSETCGVISSIASIPVPPSPTTTATVVQAAPPKPIYQESVITNTEAVETKQTKKRKAVSTATAPAPASTPALAPAPLDYAPPTSPAVGLQSEPGPQASTAWDNSHVNTDVNMEPVEKVIKKAKTETSETIIQPGHFSCLSPVPPPPPPLPAHSPASHPSPRHLPSPMPGPSGLNQLSNIRSPSHPQVREAPVSLLVSVPLPPVTHGLKLTHAKIAPPMPDMAQSPHIFHQPHKQAAMDPGMPGHSPHSVGRSAWGGLNVAYEMQDPNKPGVSGLAGTSKDANVGANIGPMPPAIRNKKRAAMATSVVSMASSPVMQNPMQNLASVRRTPQPTPPPMYLPENIKDSPPSSPSSERPLKPKIEHRSTSTAPHMLGNELNPESGAAARLQEQLSAELAAHAAGTSSAPDSLIPPPLINKAGPSTSTGSRASSAQSLDQLLERQWEQGSQFLMEQAQHFDSKPVLNACLLLYRYHIGLSKKLQLYIVAIHLFLLHWLPEGWPGLSLRMFYVSFCTVASLLSCLHQLRTENVRLEEHVGNLLQRRDHLLAVNARLAIPLTAVVTGPGEPSRCPREGGSSVRGPGPVRPNETITSERSHQLMQRPVQQKPS